jgi:serine/threonine protein kinase/Tol biopolymer transport system component
VERCVTPERWRHIEDLYHRAQAHDLADRAAFLAKACGADETLRREVESLLAQPASVEGVLERAPVAVAAQIVANAPDSVLTGRRVGVYEVLSPLGAGGMGEVYRARDTKLGRDVAIKTLKRPFTTDRERLARFEREARALAALNHPNIGAIYGFDEFEGTPVLVLELVEGETLADRLAPQVARGVGLPIDDTLKIGGQIAEGLEAAHAKGIIHRDLKPGNIKITPEGVVKVLDFGLAKLSQPPGADDPDVAVSTTMTANETQEGLIVGTAAYLSPEQARGQTIDKRTDIWAFGCVLYDMLAGRPAFAGNSVSDTIASILERDPDWRALPPSVPAHIRALVQRCLRKDRRHRLRDIGDAAIEISEASVRPMAGESPAGETFSDAPQRRPFPWPPASLVAAAAIVMLGLGWYAGRQSLSDVTPGFERMIRLISTPAHEFGPALSPDGKWVAYLSNARGPTDVWVKFIAGGEPANLTASAGIVVQSQDYIGGLDVSPDGTLIAFTAGRPGSGTTEMSTWVIPAPLGGVPRKLLNEPNQGLRWSPDGKRIAYMRPGGSAGDGLVVADADGQNERQLIDPQGGRHVHWLRWSADSRYVYFNYGIQNFNTEPTQIGRVLAAGGSLEPVVQTTRRAVYPFPSRDGTGLFYAANRDSADLSLWWRDLRSGRDYRVTSGVGEYGEPYLSPDGQRLVGTVVNARQALERVAVAFDRQVALEPLTDGFTGDFDPSWSPDGRRLAFSSSRGGNRNLWSALANLSQPMPITAQENFDERPVFSPDGRQVAFVSDRGGRRGLWVVNVDGGTPRLIAHADVLDTISWSADGRHLVSAVPGGEAPGLITVSVTDGAVARLSTPAAAHAPTWSPSGDVIAYLEPRLGLGTRLRFVTPNGQPVYESLPEVPQQLGNGVLAWSPDGRRLAAIGLPGSDAGHVWIIEPNGPMPIRKLIDLPAGDYVRGVTWTRDGSALVVGRIRWAGDIILAERSR